MREFLPFVVIGITTGSVYGLAGVGLVLTYKTSGIFNFSYGSLAAFSVFVFYFLHDQHGVPWPYAAIICVLVLAPVEGLLLELLARHLEGAGATLKVVATVGLLLVVLGVGTLWYGNSAVNFPSFLDTSTVKVAGVNVGWDQITVVLIAVAATAALYYFFRVVRIGVAMRGVVDNPELLSMTGENPVRVRRWAWVIGMVFASMAGLLLAPDLSLNALILTMLVVQAFGAAAIGYFSSLPLTFAGGAAIGITVAISTKYATQVSWLSGLSVGLPFLILFVVLIVTPRGRLAERRIAPPQAVRRSWYAPLRVRLATGAAVLVVVAFLPQMVGTHLATWSTAFVYTILFLSLGLLVRTSGQISLCHLGFAAVGAAAFGHFTTGYHLPWLVGLTLSGLVAVPIGAVVAIPAIRVSGVFLAIATFGFGVLLEQMFYDTKLMFGPTTSGIATPRPQVSIGAWHLYTDTGFYYLLLLFALMAVIGVTALQNGRMGRLLRALGDSPIALETNGLATTVLKVLVFCIAAAIAAVAGALAACLFHFGIGSSYASFNSLTLVALLIMTVAGDPWYGVIAAVAYSVIPGYVTWQNIGVYLQIGFGFFALVFALSGGRAPGPPQALRNALDRIGGRRAANPHTARAADLVVSTRPVLRRSAPLIHRVNARQPLPAAPLSPGLEVRNLTVEYGGVRAVVGLGLEAPIGRITGLVGPNGAGKTTTFNACSGLVKPNAGKVYLHGADVTGVGASGRSRLGLGRTFQRPELFKSLTVRENIELGREAAIAGGNPFSQMIAKRSDPARIRQAVDTAIEMTGIEALEEVQSSLLPPGQRRLVELARALAGPFDVLLLDEPSAGLDGSETQQFGGVLNRVVSEQSKGILLVEHDMALVQRVCSYVYVLDFGRLIFEGTPDEMIRSETVRSAYLGSDAPALEPADVSSGLVDNVQDQA